MHKKFENTQQWLDFDREHLWHPYTSMHSPLPCYPVVATDGAYIELADGQRLLDGMSSWWAAIHGYNHPVIRAALSEQLLTMPHIMFGGIAHPMASELGQRLIDITPEPLQHVFLADSGSIAIEVALKMALQYWQSLGHLNKRKLLTVRGGYHGDPFACMSVGDPDNGQHHLFTEVISKQVYAPRPTIAFSEAWEPSDIDALRELLEQQHNDIAAVIIEPIVQGAVSMRFYHPSYLASLRQLCDEFSVLLIFDEIATGFGRTGELFAMSHAGVCPDILAIGKALTGGTMTLAATLASRKVSQGISSGSAPMLMHGPTFMANPLACAAACASIDILLDESSEATYPEGWRNRISAIERSLKSLEQVADHPAVANVRVLGAIGVVQMHNLVDVAKVQARLVEKSVWVRPFGHLIYVMPPYILSAEQLSHLCTSIVDTIIELY